MLEQETIREREGRWKPRPTLSGSDYTSPEVWEEERERIWFGDWVCIGRAEEVANPGDYLVRDLVGESIFITRNAQGELHGFYNVCSHRGTKFLDDEPASGNVRKAFVCPYHSWTYDLEGTCLGTPLFEGADIPEDQRGIFDMSDVKGFDRADYGLMPVNVDSWGFLVFVNLDPDAAPLHEQLGDLPERCSGYHLEEWKVMRQRDYEIGANYKLIGENFMEFYHLPWVHPELVKVSRMEDHYRWQGPGKYTGMCTTPISRNTEDGGWEGLPPMDALDEDDAQSGRFIWLFPNTAVNILPNHSFVMITRPQGPDRTVESTFILSHPGSVDTPGSGEALDQLAKFWNLVNVQDVEIVELVQQGISNPAYRGGRMCYRFEEPLHRYQNMIIDRMVGTDRIPPGDQEESVQMFRSNGSLEGI